MPKGLHSTKLDSLLGFLVYSLTGSGSLFAYGF